MCVHVLCLHKCFLVAYHRNCSLVSMVFHLHCPLVTKISTVTCKLRLRLKQRHQVGCNLITTVLLDLKQIIYEAHSLNSFMYLPKGCGKIMLIYINMRNVTEVDKTLSKCKISRIKCVCVCLNEGCFTLVFNSIRYYDYLFKTIQLVLKMLLV